LADPIVLEVTYWEVQKPPTKDYKTIFLGKFGAYPLEGSPEI
jgi:hypothetical protein